MKKLIQGIVEFRNNLTDENRELFAKLALGQTPDALFIACSDSRVVPNLFASTNPGDLFVLRAVGNFIPPSHDTSHERILVATIEFSVFSLNVSEIIICGHSECGAMQALLNGFDSPCCPNLVSCLKYGENVLKQIKQGHTLDPTLSKHNQVSQLNVLQQMEHIQSYPWIKEKITNKELSIHGWWFDIAQATVYSYDKKLNKFVPIDESHLQLFKK